VECTYTLQNGTCTDSLALITARQYGIDENVVRRAEELGLQFDKRIRGAVTHSNNSVQNSLLELLDETGNISQTSSLNVFGSNLGAVESYDLSRDVKPLLVGLLSPGSNSEALVVIDVDRTPPASQEGQSCLYVLHIHKINCQSRLYVGETESIRQRLDRHRSHSGRDGWKVECLVLPVTVGGKSSARKLETSLIKKLKQMGFHLDSSGDEKHSLFGSA
jgi:predicted GIY-YIG superfamily endonuclease